MTRRPAQVQWGDRTLTLGEKGPLARFDRHKVLAALMLVMLTAVLVAKLLRAGFESSIWMDEVFSLELATKQASSIVELSRQDVHPPLYYLGLRAWIWAGTHVGLSESIGLARSLNVLVWVLLVAATYGFVRIRASVSHGALAAGLMGLSPGVVQLTQDARSYGFALFGVTIAFLALTLDLEDSGKSRSQGRAAWLCWILAMLLATWSHNLSWFAAAAMVVAWFLARLRVGRFTPRLLVGALLGNLMVATLTSPWLWSLSKQVSALTTSAPTWMTPPTVGNYLRVFVLWLPLGRDAGSFVAAYPWLWAFVIAAWGTLLLAIFGDRSNPWRTIAGAQAVGIWASVLFVALLWGSARWLNLPIFHGPRYPLLISGIWTAGLWSVMSSRNERVASGYRGWILAAPWLACGALSLGLASSQEARAAGGILAELQPRGAEERGASYLPAELGPYFEKTLRRLSAVPLDEGGCAPTPALSRDLILLNPWRGLDTPAALLQISALKMGHLGEFRASSLPPATRDFELIRFETDDWTRRFADRVCPALDQLRSKPERGAPEQWADLTKQLASDGWSYLEFDRRLQPFRWTSRRVAVLRFEGDLAAGNYELRLVGRLGTGEELEVEIPSGALKRTFRLENSAVDLTVPFTLRESERRPLRVRLNSDVQQVRAGGQEGYLRDLGLLLREASVRRAP